MSLQTKTSFGIILCRKNFITLRPEVLLVHKRYTYAFAEFVHGRYSRPPPRNGHAAAALSSVAAILDGMSREELLDIYSLNFSQMWYRIWLSHDNQDLYNKKHARFQSTFMRDDGGATLRSMVLNARGGGTLMWEVPKGRRLGMREPDITCAMRELREETGVEKDEYRLVPGVRRHTSYISNGVRYTGIYFIAVANPALSRSTVSTVGFGGAGFATTLRDIHNLAEISEVRWQDIERIRMLDGTPPRLLQLIRPAFRIVQNFYTGKISERRINRTLESLFTQSIFQMRDIPPAVLLPPVQQKPLAAATGAQKRVQPQKPLEGLPPQTETQKAQAQIKLQSQMQPPQPQQVQPPQTQPPQPPQVQPPQPQRPQQVQPRVQPREQPPQVQPRVQPQQPPQQPPHVPPRVLPQVQPRVQPQVLPQQPPQVQPPQQPPQQPPRVQPPPPQQPPQVRPQQSSTAQKRQQHQSQKTSPRSQSYALTTSAKSSEWCTIISRRHAKSMRGRRGQLRGTILVDMQIPSGIETISDAIVSKNWRSTDRR